MDQNSKTNETRKLPILIRDAQPEDVSFIFNSWLKSYRSGLLARSVDNTIYYSEHHKLIERILKTSTVKIACNPEDIATIYGYLCFERIDGIFIGHFGYTKGPFRNLGVFSQLLKCTEHNFQNAGLFTHYTDKSRHLATRYNLVYHPYILLNYNLNPGKQDEVK